MPDYPKSIKRLIREWSAEAHERELHRALTELDRKFVEWREGKIGSGELTELIHKFHNGPARELWKQYNYGEADMNVAYAIVTGILSRDEVPSELVDALDGPIAFYEGLKQRGELRMP